MDSSSGDTDEFIKTVKDSLQRGRYDTTSTHKHFGMPNSEDEQPSLPLDDEADIGSSGNSLTQLVELSSSDDDDDPHLTHLQNDLLKVKQTTPGVEDLILHYPNDNGRNDEG